MKNTTDTPLLTKENNKQVKDKFTPLRYFITDVDIYQEEEIIGDAREGEILNTLDTTSNIEGTSNSVHDDLPNSSETNDENPQVSKNNPNEKLYWCCGWMFRKT